MREGGAGVVSVLGGTTETEEVVSVDSSCVAVVVVVLVVLVVVVVVEIEVVVAVVVDVERVRGSGFFLAFFSLASGSDSSSRMSSRSSLH
jgi:hypothetical protein